MDFSELSPSFIFIKLIQLQARSLVRWVVCCFIGTPDKTHWICDVHQAQKELISNLFFQRQRFGFNSYILVLFDAKYQSMGGCCIWLPTLAWSLQSVLLVRSLLLIFQFPRKQRNTCLLQKKTYQMGLIPTQDSAQKSKEIFDSPSEMHKKHLNRTDANLAPKNSTKHTWIAAWAIQIIIGRFICLLV